MTNGEEMTAFVLKCKYLKTITIKYNFIIIPVPMYLKMNNANLTKMLHYQSHVTSSFDWQSVADGLISI